MKFKLFLKIIIPFFMTQNIMAEEAQLVDQPVVIIEDVEDVDDSDVSVDWQEPQWKAAEISCDHEVFEEVTYVLHEDQTVSRRLPENAVVIGWPVYTRWSRSVSFDDPNLIMIVIRGGYPSEDFEFGHELGEFVNIGAVITANLYKEQFFTDDSVKSATTRFFPQNGAFQTESESLGYCRFKVTAP